MAHTSHILTPPPEVSRKVPKPSVTTATTCTSPSPGSTSSNGHSPINGAVKPLLESQNPDLSDPELDQGMDSGHINTASLDTTTSLGNSAPPGTVNLRELEKTFQAVPERAREVAEFSECMHISASSLTESQHDPVLFQHAGSESPIELYDSSDPAQPSFGLTELYPDSDPLYGNAPTELYPSSDPIDPHTIIM